MDDPQVLFGRRLRELRKQRGWSQERLALEARMDRSYVGAVERGEQNIALKNICKLAGTLKVKSADLLTLIDK